MPSISSTSPRLTGPILNVYVGVTEARQKALAAAGETVPSMVPARMLIDTGASGTVIDPCVLQQLGISPSGMIEAHTPSTQAGKPHMMAQYDVRLAVANHQSHRFFDAVAVTEAHLAHQGIEGLIGRDILAECVLVYNGEADFYTLCF